MKRNWLNTWFGLNFVAIGLLALCIGVALVLFQDIWFMAAGASPEMWQYEKVLSYLAAGVAAVFSIASLFVTRPGLPKYVAAIIVISLASYVVQPLLPVHGYRQVAVLCIARILGCCTLLLLVREYVRDLKAGKVAG